MHTDLFDAANEPIVDHQMSIQFEMKYHWLQRPICEVSTAMYHDWS